jgi:hypothetical protein
VNSWRAALSLALAAFVLWRNLPAAILCLFPRLMRARGEDETWPKVDRELFAQMEEELSPLGFKRLGVHVERAPLSRGQLAYDFVNEAEGTWCTATARGEEGALYLLTPFEGGRFVRTADHRVASIERPGECLSGGMPGAQPEQVFAAHRRRVERLKEAGRALQADLSLEARVKAANRWFEGCGARELRTRNLNGLVMTAMGIGIAGVVAWALLRMG